MRFQEMSKESLLYLKMTLYYYYYFDNDTLLFKFEFLKKKKTFNFLSYNQYEKYYFQIICEVVIKLIIQGQTKFLY